MIYVEVAQTKGSAPRDAGTVMGVAPDHIQGTIGGGALEYEAIRLARDMLQNGAAQHQRHFPLGPSLGQCCGGAVTLSFSKDRSNAQTHPKPPALPQLDVTSKRPLWVWGAGHVGRAIALQANHTKAYAITLIDAFEDKFPNALPETITPVCCTDMPRLARHAPADASHVIATYAHDIDLALCGALLNRGFAFCGLIGSDTKWARFQRRLSALGLDPTGITSPIGDKTLGKHPDMIAYGTVKALIDMQHPGARG